MVAKGCAIKLFRVGQKTSNSAGAERGTDNCGCSCQIL